MSIKRDTCADWRVRCTKCGGTHSQPRSLTFEGVVAAVKRAGWRISKLYDVWCHFCPSCEHARIVARVDVDRLVA